MTDKPRAMTTCVPVLVLLLAATVCLAKPPRPTDARKRPISEAEMTRAEARLVEEFKSGTIPGDRTAEQIQTDAGRVISYLLNELAGSGGSRYRTSLALGNMEAICFRSARLDDDRVREALCRELVGALVADANSPQGGRRIVAQMLQDIGGAECVDGLGELLKSANPLCREQARCILEKIPAPAAIDKLHQALFAAIESQWQIGLINSLGARRDAASIDWIARMLKNRDASVAQAAATALGSIGSTNAVGILNDLRLVSVGELHNAIGDALLACAENALSSGDTDTALTIWRKMYENPTEARLLRIAALRAMVAAQGAKAVGVVVGLVAGDDQAIKPVAMELAREIPGEQATRAFAALLAKASDEAMKVEMIDLLGDRGDTVARATVLAELRGAKWHAGVGGKLRLAVIRAIGGVGTEADAMMLVRLAVQADEQERTLARASLRRLRGEKVDAALIEGIHENDPAVRCEVLRALGQRGAGEMTLALLTLATDPEPNVRYAALGALSVAGDERALMPLVKWFCRATNPTEADRCEQAMAGICRRTDAQDLVAASIAEAFKDADAKTKCALMQSCGQLAGAKALETLIIGVGDPNEVVQEAALKAMSHSPEKGGAADQLMIVARSAKRKDQKALALSGYLRLSRYLPLPAEKKFWAYIQIMDLAERPEERKLAVKSLGDIQTVGALTMAMERIDNPELVAEAEYAACRIGAQIYAANPDEVLAAMQRITGKTESASTLKEARRIQALAQAVLDKRKAAASAGN